MTECHSSPVDTERARQLFQQVCSLAGTALHVSRARIDNDVDELQADIQALRTLVGQMACIADLGDRQLGGAGSLATAEDWLLSPA